MSGNGVTCFGPWRVTAASVRGPAHVRRDMPNQDAWAAEAGSDGVAFAAAVCDGHGAKLHFRSEIGARIAASTAAECLSTTAAPASELPARIADTWRGRVLAHRQANPHELDDWVEDEGELVLAYGTTLIAAQIRDAALTALQIGDGDLLVGTAENGIVAPLPEDQGITGEATHSLCEPEAASRFRLAELPAGVDFLMLSTDGVGKSFGSPADLAAVARHFREQARAGRLDQIAASLPGWLGDVATRGAGDDATLLIAYLDQPTG